MPPDYATLQARHERDKADAPDEFNLRIHRSLSWLGHSERMAQAADQDAQFISLWIAFNAAYAGEVALTDERPELKVFQEFVKNLCWLDCQGERLLEGIVGREYERGIKRLLSNQYIYHLFWMCQRENPEQHWWRKPFHAENRQVAEAFASGNPAFGASTAAVLSAVFSRLYMLRNQVLHGHATWDGRVNRAQIGDGAALLAQIVPSIIKIMMDNPGNAWPKPLYPVVNTPDRPGGANPA